jgi:hypothetical protein
MIRKSLSLITASGMLYVYLLSQLRSGDALFLVASSSILINLALLALAASSVYVAFLEDRFKSARQYAISAGLAIGLGVIGFIGAFYAGMDDSFGGVIKPFDYLVMLQLGIIFGICSLSYRHQPFKLSKLSSIKLTFMPRLKQQLVNIIEANKPALPGSPSRAGSA